MLSFFGFGPKIQLEKNAEVELEFDLSSGKRSYFVQTLSSNNKGARFKVPREGKRAIDINPNDPVLLIMVQGDKLMEVESKITTIFGDEFEIAFSRNIKKYDLKKSEKGGPAEVVIETPVDFRAISTSHVQRAITKKVAGEYMEIETNLPVPPGMQLKLTLKVPESPALDAEGTVESSDKMGDDSRKCLTRVALSEKTVTSDVFSRFARFCEFYTRRKGRRGDEEEQQPGLR